MATSNSKVRAFGKFIDVSRLAAKIEPRFAKLYCAGWEKQRLSPGQAITIAYRDGDTNRMLDGKFVGAFFQPDGVLVGVATRDGGRKFVWLAASDKVDSGIVLD